MTDVLFLARDHGDGPVSDAVRAGAEAVREQGGDAHVLCFDDHHATEQDGDLTVHRVNFMLDGDTLFSWGMLINIEFIRKIRDLFEHTGFDVVHGHNWEAIPATMTASAAFDVPAVLTMHGLEGENPERLKQDAIRTIEVDGMRAAHLVLTPYEDLKQQIAAYEIDTPTHVTETPGDAADHYTDLEVDATHEDPDAYVGIPSE